MYLTIRLIKPAKERVITYPGQLLQRSEQHILVRTVWAAEMGRVDLGFVAFEPDDYLYEHFYSDRWYNVFELHAPDGSLKGWYCNLTRPAVFHAESIDSEDLEMDLFVAPQRDSMRILDEDEYAALALEQTDPAAHAQVQAALAELQALARRGEQPFQPRDA
jgi:hypothetical protein